MSFKIEWTVVYITIKKGQKLNKINHEIKYKII